MESVDLSPDAVMDMLCRRKEKERADEERRENLNRIREEIMIQELQSLQDEQAQIVENINKNLKTIVAQKHGLQKIIQGSECESPKLPITHKHQEDAIHFVSNAIDFVNNFANIQKSIASENDIDTIKLCNEINVCGESVNQELNRSKIRVDQVGKLRENAEIIKDHCFIPCDDDLQASME